MIISDLFEVGYGQRIYHSKSFLDDKIGKIPLISSGKNNHGLYGTFDVKPAYKNVISVANTGSVGWTFYHNYNCCVDDNCLVLIPKKKMSDQQMIYISMLINRDKYRYMYGRQVTPARIGNIELPNIPNFVNKKEFPNGNKIKKPVSNKEISFNVSAWKWFEYKNLFDVRIGKSIDLNKLDQSDNGINYIGRTEENNGITAKVVNDGNFVVYYGNCITVPMVGNELKSSYQSEQFCVSQNIAILRPKEFSLNIFTASFLNTIIRKDIFRFAYGRTLSLDRLKMLKIKLPVDRNGKPDWQFMEDYIKSLPYSASLQ